MLDDPRVQATTGAGLIGLSSLAPLLHTVNEIAMTITLVTGAIIGIIGVLRAIRSWKKDHQKPKC